jgi:hypothetical protein
MGSALLTGITAPAIRFGTVCQMGELDLFEFERFLGLFEGVLEVFAAVFKGRDLDP